jgi:hypothetical protein
METEDYHDLVNALLDGPSEEATASFEVEWRRKIQTQELIVGTVDRQFRGTFTQTNARVKMVGAQEGFRIPVGLGGAGRPLGRSRRGAQRRLLLLTAARRKVKSDRQSDCESDFGIVPEDCDQAAPRKSDAGRLPARRKIWDGTSLSSSLTDIHSGA